MTGQQALTLYSRPDCHLCDEALEMLADLGIGCEVVNIENDLALVRRYGTRVPVLRRGDEVATLDWPFTEEDVHDYLGEFEDV